MEDLLQGEEDIWSEEAVADRILYLDVVVLWWIVDQFNHIPEFLIDAGEVFVREMFKKWRILLSLFEVVQFVQVGSQMPYDYPAFFWFLQYVL